MCEQATNSIYSTQFFNAQSSASSRSAQKIVPYVMDLLQPTSVVDVGCGVGTWLEAFRNYGVQDILGIDGEWVNLSQLRIPEETFLGMNLTRPNLTSDRSFDLAVSLEVAEHLPPESANRFVGFITSLAPVVLFSAAIPGQGGAEHLNEQWPQYWFELFDNAGYQVIDCIRPRIWELDDIQPWYAQNAFLYIDRVRSDSYSELLSDSIATQMPSKLRLIHPGLFEMAAERPATGPAMFAESVRRLTGRLRRRLTSNSQSITTLPESK